MRFPCETKAGARARPPEWMVDHRSLALHQAIAAKVRRNPEHLLTAKSNLKHWTEPRPSVPAAFCEWKTILETWTVENILVLLTNSDQKARRLRQSSPFYGILTSQERNKVFEQVDHKLDSESLEK